MAPPIRRNPTKADEHRSTAWQIAVLNSISAGIPKKVAAGVAVFDLVNREAARAHRLSLIGGGKGTKMPVSGTFKRSRYGYFETKKLVTFKDFDGVFMELERTSAAVWEKFKIKIRESANPTSAVLAEVKISGRGLGIPDWKGKLYGITEIHFSDGKPVGTPEFVPPIGPGPRHPVDSDSDWRAKPILLPADVLFDFDSAKLKEVHTGNHYGGGVLDQVGLQFDDQRETDKDTVWYKRVLIRGATDSIGSREYNQALSERRAEAVAKWFIDNKYLAHDEVRTEGLGEDRPRAPNQTPDGRDNPEGRRLNRFVEIWLLF
jgi:outer membrane protein OmpA-like peptidoglycan-associated protein